MSQRISLILKIIKYLKPYAGLSIIFIFLSLFSGIFDGVSIALIIPTIQSVISEKADMQGYSTILKMISKPFLNFLPLLRLQILAFIILFATLLKNLCIWLASCISRWLMYEVRWQIVSNIFKQILEVEYGYISNKKSGEIYSWLDFEASRVATALHLMLQLVTVSGIILVYALSMFIFSWQVTLIVMGPLIVLLLSTNRVNRILKSFGEKLSETTMSIFSYWIEILQGLRTVRLFRNYDFEIKRHEKYWKDWNILAMKKFMLIDLLKPGSETLVMLFLVMATIAFASIIVSKGAQILSILLVFVYILKLLQIQINNFNSLAASLASELPAINVIEEAMCRDNKPYIKSGIRRFAGLKDGIAFKEVSFRYAKNKEYALKDVTFVISKGMTTALVGSSGAGKSTLVDLLFRLYDPLGGEILVDGQSLKDLRLEDWQSNIGFVSQDTFIFNASASDNIAYGKLGASRAEIIDAAARANAHDFIQDLPAGYNTVLGDRGFKLSGGQRQRIAIARAILKNPDILILDEATSALDTESEQLVQNAIRNLSRDRTALVIAHRLSTIEHADQVVVLEQGTVVEVGSHKELLMNNGRYAKLHHLQYKNVYEKKND